MELLPRDDNFDKDHKFGFWRHLNPYLGSHTNLSRPKRNVFSFAKSQTNPNWFNESFLVGLPFACESLIRRVCHSSKSEVLRFARRLWLQLSFDVYRVATLAKQHEWSVLDFLFWNDYLPQNRHFVSSWCFKIIFKAHPGKGQTQEGFNLTQNTLICPTLFHMKHERRRSLPHNLRFTSTTRDDGGCCVVRLLV